MNSSMRSLGSRFYINKYFFAGSKIFMMMSTMQMVSFSFSTKIRPGWATWNARSCVLFFCCFRCLRQRFTKRLLEHVKLNIQERKETNSYIFQVLSNLKPKTGCQKFENQVKTESFCIHTFCSITQLQKCVEKSQIDGVCVAFSCFTTVKKCISFMLSNKLSCKKLCKRTKPN